MGYEEARKNFRELYLNVQRLNFFEADKVDHVFENFIT